MLRPSRGRLKRRGLTFLVLTLICLVLIVEYNRSSYDIDSLDLEISKCPACLGDDFCPTFFQGKIKLKKPSLFKYFFNAKNVVDARYESQNVVLKKLGHVQEWQDFDQKMCKSAYNEDFLKCSVGNAVRYLSSLWMTSKGILNHSVLKDHLPDSSELFTCDQSSELIAFLQSRMSSLWKSKPEHFLTTVMINPEPIIAMAFPDTEGWPFPKYYGACGRVAVFEHAGQPLANFLGADWVVRARLSLQILQLATKMSENPTLNLYLTDWSLDNFAVNSKLQVKLIDLENIILVNKTEIEQVKAPGWDIAHHSTAFGCEKRHCFSYFAPDLCSHQQSDHNYFGACQGVIVPLLSNDVPDQMVKRLIQECAWPSNPGGRLEAVDQLKDRLLQI